jgi:fatty-acyl-CoA synthase
MWDSMNIAEWVRKWSCTQPDRIAIYFANQEISYRRLHEQVCRMAAYLRAQGFRAGQRVAVLMDNCPAFIEIYLACAKTGLILVPLNTRWSADEVGWAKTNSEPVAIIFHKKYEQKITECLEGTTTPEILAIGIPENDADGLTRVLAQNASPSADDRCSPVALPPDSPHVIMYTSGTTGRPKGAILSIRKTFFNCLNAQLFLDLKNDDRMLLNVPLFHSGGLFIQASPILYRGASLVLHPNFDAKATYQDICRYQITTYSAVPTIMKRLLTVDQDSRADLSSLRICAVGGEKLTDDLIKQCQAAGFPMSQIMGQTETSIILWATTRELADFPNTLGKPVLHASVELFDEQGDPAQAGEIGEIAVSGPTLMNGYWRLPDNNQSKIRNGWLFTGDMARKNKAGYFFMVDRQTDMFISGGENVYPAEVERVLKGHASVDDVVVIGEEDVAWGQTGHAFIIKKPETTLTEADVRAYCERRLARFKWPSKITFCKDFPRTALGKIIKQKVNTGP